MTLPTPTITPAVPTAVVTVNYDDMGEGVMAALQDALMQSNSQSTS